jgi:flagellar basal body rod protein FlgB
VTALVAALRRQVTIVVAKQVAVARNFANVDTPRRHRGAGAARRATRISRRS